MSYSKVIKAPKGKMVVRTAPRDRRSIGVLVICPKSEVHLYTIMDKDEAIALEAQWQAEGEAKAEEAQP